MRESGVEITFHPKSGRGQRLLTLKRISQPTAATATTAFANSNGSPYESGTSESSCGGISLGKAGKPADARRPTPKAVPCTSLTRRSDESVVAGEAVAAVGCEQAPTSFRRDLCVRCGQVDWIWDGSAWLCALCGEPAHSGVVR